MEQSLPATETLATTLEVFHKHLVDGGITYDLADNLTEQLAHALLSSDKVWSAFIYRTEGWS